MKEAFVIIFLIFSILTIRSTIFELYTIPTESMVPTIKKDGVIIVNKMHYGIKKPFSEYNDIKYLYKRNKPKRGDIIAFQYPKDKNITFVKRIIGLPNDIIEFKKNKIFVNNKEIKYINKKFSYKERKLIVPEGDFFVLGDNRENSSDSRVWGTVPFINIKGIVFHIF